MRLLFIAPYLPSPIRVRSFEFLRALGGFDVDLTLVCPVAPHEQPDVAALRDLGITVVGVSVLPQQRVHATLGGAIAGLPLQAAYGTPEPLQRALYQVVAHTNFDIVHIEHLRAAGLFPIVQHLPVVYDAVDSISLLLERTARAGPDRRSRWLARLELAATRRFERQMAERASAVTVTSPEDAAAFTRLAPGTAVHILPNGVDLDRFPQTTQQRAEDVVILTGKMSYHANVAAAQRLVHQIMPLVWHERPQTRLWLVGADPPSTVQRFARDPRIWVSGRVPNIATTLQQATVAVSPLRYGVGIQNKVLEAMATGTPTIADRQCLGALDAVPDRDLVIADDDQAFADRLLELLGDGALRERIGAAGRCYVERAHRWERSAARLVELYDDVRHHRASEHTLPVTYPREAIV